MLHPTASDLSAAGSSTELMPAERGASSSSLDEPPVAHSPSKYPPVDLLFASYPSEWIDARSELIVNQERLANLDELLDDPLLNHSVPWRSHRSSLVSVLCRVTVPITGAMLAAELGLQSDSWHAMALIAWLGKYDVVRPAPASRISKKLSVDDADSESAAVTFVVTCMGRLDHLRQSLPLAVAQPGARVIVVDYSCPNNAGDWVRENLPPVRVVSVPGKRYFDRSDAKNAGVAAVATPWVCLLDADVLLAPDFMQRVAPRLKPGRIVRSSLTDRVEGVAGTFLVEKTLFDQVGGHDIVYQGWGDEDQDLVDACRFAGARLELYPSDLVTHIDHADDRRLDHHQQSDRGWGHMVNRIYRAAKWDWARIVGQPPELPLRRQLYEQVCEQVRSLEESGRGEVTVDLGRMRWSPTSAGCHRVLQYRLSPGEAGRSLPETQ